MLQFMRLRKPAPDDRVPDIVLSMLRTIQPSLKTCQLLTERRFAPLFGFPWKGKVAAIRRFLFKVLEDVFDIDCERVTRVTA